MQKKKCVPSPSVFSYVNESIKEDNNSIKGLSNEGIAGFLILCIDINT